MKYVWLRKRKIHNYCERPPLSFLANCPVWGCLASPWNTSAAAYPIRWSNYILVPYWPETAYERVSATKTLLLKEKNESLRVNEVQQQCPLCNPIARERCHTFRKSRVQTGSWFSLRRQRFRRLPLRWRELHVHACKNIFPRNVWVTKRIPVHELSLGARYRLVGWWGANIRACKTPFYKKKVLSRYKKSPCTIFPVKHPIDQWIGDVQVFTRARIFFF